jgi:hypothetical protein
VYDLTDENGNPYNALAAMGQPLSLMDPLVLGNFLVYPYYIDAATFTVSDPDACDDYRRAFGGPDDAEADQKTFQIVLELGVGGEDSGEEGCEVLQDET